MSARRGSSSAGGWAARFWASSASSCRRSASPGCARDPRDGPCPSAAVGELVLSELRGAQPSSDTLGQWIEIYNATDRTIDLAGLVVDMRKLDGSNEVRIIVRGGNPQISPRGYA